MNRVFALLSLLLVSVTFSAFGQARPAFLDYRRITVKVLNDGGRTIVPEVSIRRGDRVRVRVFQGRGFEMLEAANYCAALAPRGEGEDQPGSAAEQSLWSAADDGRARAQTSAHNFDWIAGRDVSLAHLRRILKVKVCLILPPPELHLPDRYRAASAILLKLNDREFQVTEDRTCGTKLLAYGG